MVEGRGALRRTGVSLKRVEATGLGVAWGLGKGGGVSGGGVWLREVELLRLVLWFSRGVDEGRSVEDAAVEEAEEGGRWQEEGGFSRAAEGAEQAEPGLLGAGFLFGLFSEAAPGEAAPPDGPLSSLSSAVRLLAAQLWLSTDVAAAPSRRDESEDCASLPAPPAAPPPRFLELPERSSEPTAPCLDALGVTVQVCACCPLVCEWTLVMERETPLAPSPGLHTCQNTSVYLPLITQQLARIRWR